MDVPAALSIRPFTPDDSIPQLTALLHRAYARLAELGLRFHATYQGDEVTRDRVASGECYVGVLDGRIVATILFRPPERTKGQPWYDRPEVSMIGQFAVEPALQRHGLGAQMMDFVEARARQSGASELALDTAEGATHLIEYYTRRGYRFIEYVQWSRDVVNYRSVIMSKALKKLPAEL